jgi:hypothetical protein
MTYGEQRCNYHLQVYLFYQQRKKKTSSILLKSSPPLPKAWPGGAACSVDRSGEEDSQNRPLTRKWGPVLPVVRKQAAFIVIIGGIPRICRSAVSRFN